MGIPRGELRITGAAELDECGMLADVVGEAFGEFVTGSHECDLAKASEHRRKRSEVFARKSTADTEKVRLRALRLFDRLRTRWRKLGAAERHDVELGWIELKKADGLVTSGGRVAGDGVSKAQVHDGLSEALLLGFADAIGSHERNQIMQRDHFAHAGTDIGQ